MAQIRMLCFLFVMVGCAAEQGLEQGGAPQTHPVADQKPLPVEAAQPVGDAEAAAGGAQIQRKIIFRADLDIVVEDFSSIPSQVEDIIRRCNAFVADSEITGTANSSRKAYWTVRVPVEHYHDFLVASRLLGEVRRESQNAQDVSEKFYDLQARAANQQHEEQRLKELLDRHGGKLEDILTVEKEIARVREEIERLQGQLRMVADLTTYSTVTLKFNEVVNYEPEQAATFSTRIRRTWSSSTGAIIQLGQFVTLLLVCLAPWLAMLTVPLTVVILWMRVRQKNLARS